MYQSVAGSIYRLIIVCIALLVIMAGLFSIRASALSVKAPSDCDDNAVIRCGVLSISELKQKSHEATANDIYSYFHITQQDVANMESTSVVGSVSKDGTVRVNGKVVATNALTAGRQNIVGSKSVTQHGTNFYVRSTAVSFVSSPQPAFVVMQNHHFSFAILASCGNPVVAKAVNKPPVKKKTQPASTLTPQSPPQVVQSTQVTINQPAVPAPLPPPSVAPIAAVLPAQTQSLPNTGSGNPWLLGSLAATVGSSGHFLYKLNRRIRGVL